MSERVRRETYSTVVGERCILTSPIEDAGGCAAARARAARRRAARWTMMTAATVYISYKHAPAWYVRTKLFFFFNVFVRTLYTCFLFTAARSRAVGAGGGARGDT